MVGAVLALIRWLTSLIWSLARRKSIDWGTKLQSLNIIFDRIIKAVFKKSVDTPSDSVSPNVPRVPGFRIRRWFKRLRGK